MERLAKLLSTVGSDVGDHALFYLRSSSRACETEPRGCPRWLVFVSRSRVCTLQKSHPQRKIGHASKRAIDTVSVIPFPAPNYTATRGYTYIIFWWDLLDELASDKWQFLCQHSSASPPRQPQIALELKGTSYLHNVLSYSRDLGEEVYSEPKTNHGKRTESCSTA